MSDFEVEGEVISEEDADPGAASEVRTLPQRYVGATSVVLREDVRSAALAVAGGALAGAVTVAAVRAVGSVGSKKRTPKRTIRRQDGPAANVLASRSFLVDVHLLGR